MSKQMTALIIMDGFGINPAHEGNAIYMAGTPELDKLKARYPHTQLGASGMDVGLPDGQMGNSEVGHLNMGAGRIVYQELTRITKDIQDGVFFEKEPLIWAMDSVKENGGSRSFLFSDNPSRKDLKAREISGIIKSVKV